MQHRNDFDPRNLGAKCDECPFRRSIPRKPQGRVPARGLVILDNHPSFDGVSFIGGWKRYRLDKALGRGPRYETALTLCEPGQGRSVSVEESNKAIACCAPRLTKELDNVVTYIVPMTDDAWRAVSGAPTNILNYVGHPYGRVFPAIPFPSVRANPAMIPAFDFLLRRVQDTLAGRSFPEPWPPILTSSGAERLEALRRFASGTTPIAFDVETMGKSAFAPLRCVGLSDGTVGVSLEWPLQGEEEKLFREILANPNIPLIMHNAQHDWISAEHWGYKIAGTVHDTLLLHAVHALQMPHGLNLVAALTTYRPAWKQLFKDGRPELKGTDFWTQVALDNLMRYNAKDAIQTAVIFQRLYPMLAGVEKGFELYNEYIQLMEIAKCMRVRGVCVSEEHREAHRVALRNKMDEIREAYHKHLNSLGLDVDKYSLGAAASSPKLKTLFFKHFGITPSSYSPLTGEPVLDGASLGKLSVHVDADVAETAKHILYFRKYAKLYNTYIKNLPVVSGRIHCEWKVFGTVTGRWSSAGPNMQNIPKPNKTLGTTGLRDMFVADEGQVLVAADFSALELRLIALVTGAEKLIKWFQEGRDVHAMNASMFFGKPVEECGDGSLYRNLAKNCIYAFTYNMSDDVTTIWERLVLDFPKISVGQVKTLRTNLFKTHPEIQRWQYEAAKIANDFKYVEAPISGRREIFHDGHVDINKVLNYPFQSSGGDLMNRAVINVHKDLDPSRGEAVLMQIHDELVVTGPDADRLTRILQRHMAQDVTLNGQTLHFPIDVAVGTNWGKL